MTFRAYHNTYSCQVISIFYQNF